jgi:hypothetical protein
VNGILYAVGGTKPSVILNTVEAYDPLTNTWTPKAPMPTAPKLYRAVWGSRGGGERHPVRSRGLQRHYPQHGRGV